MQVRMKLEGLSPGVEDSEKTDLRPEMLRIRRNGSQCLGRDTKEHAKNQLFVLVCDGGDLPRHGKDNVKIADFQEFGLTVFYPLRPGQTLALWAVAIPAANGEISISCLMGSIPLWGVQQPEERAARVHTPLPLSIKIWSSRARSACRAGETCPSEDVVGGRPQLPRVSRWDRPERRSRS